MSDEKHSLRILSNEESYFSDEIKLQNVLGFFACRDCGRHFYILKSELYPRLTGETTVPLRFTRDLLLQDSAGEWQLVFTLGT